MKRTSFPVPEDASVSSKRKTRSDRSVDLLNRSDLQALREFRGDPESGSDGFVCWPRPRATCTPPEFYRR